MGRRAPFSIALRLTELTVLASGTALVTACLAFGLYDRSTFRSALAERVLTQAQVLAANSRSALVFDDAAAANTTLGALRGAAHIVSAVVFRPDGTLLASYSRDGSSVPPALPTLPTNGGASRFEPDRLVLTQPILLQDKRIGTIAMVSDLGELAERQRDYFKMSVVTLIVSLAAALLMSWLSQRTIARPIVDLARLAHSVSIDRDYSRRAALTAGTAEVTMLAETFNHMLGQIQEGARSLQRAHDELEERVTRRTAELDAANRELEAFSYSVSHDLRAPLRHVSGFAELLQEHAGARLNDQDRKYVTTITSAARRMAHLIDDLLDFSRLGRTPLKSQRVSLSAVVAEARREVSSDGADPLKPERHIDWQIAPLPDAAGDAAMLRLVFVNLLSNAVKYTSTRPSARIEVGTLNGTSGQVEVFVRDNGVGFDMQYAGKLFGVFQRLHGANEFEGTGIGLANVKRTVTRHGGRVWAFGEVDHGATFHVTLPKWMEN